MPQRSNIVGPKNFNAVLSIGSFSQALASWRKDRWFPERRDRRDTPKIQPTRLDRNQRTARAPSIQLRSF
jgi:hypothetical protein